jgi:hypothetical protein
VKFAFISAEKAWAPVSVLCRILGVTRSGFYAWEECCLPPFSATGCSRSSATRTESFPAVGRPFASRDEVG